MILRRLDASDAAEYRRLRLFALRESADAFGSSYEEEAPRSLTSFATRLEPTENRFTFGAFRGRSMVGMVTLIRDEQLKMRHKAAVYALYVAPRLRRQGIARDLLTLAISAAKQMPGVNQLRLAAAASNRPALRLYRSLGFVVYGEEPRALFVAGRYLAEKLMVLKLRSRPTASRRSNTARRKKLT